MLPVFLFSSDRAVVVLSSYDEFCRWAFAELFGTLARLPLSFY